jgi:hypothetical protein
MGKDIRRADCARADGTHYDTRAAIAAADRGWSATQTAIIEGFGRERWASLVKTLEELAACALASPRNPIKEA